MTYRDYMREHTTENLSWCACYKNATGDHAMVVNEGKIITIVSPRGEESSSYSKEINAAALEQFVREVNPDFDLYEGWGPLHIATDAMKEVGCAHCPWFDMCEAMDEQYGPDEEEE